MNLLCTAPCQPRCAEPAAHTLTNAKSGAVLGMNCEQHLSRLNKDDYGRTPLPTWEPATYPKLSTEEYTYAVMIRGGAYITLRQTSTGKTKEFFMAGCGVESLSSIENHMNSLTDDLCSQWFNERVKKGKAAK